MTYSRLPNFALASAHGFPAVLLVVFQLHTPDPASRRLFNLNPSVLGRCFPILVHDLDGLLTLDLCIPRPRL